MCIDSPRLLVCIFTTKRAHTHTHSHTLSHTHTHTHTLLLSSDNSPALKRFILSISFSLNSLSIFSLYSTFRMLQRKRKSTDHRSLSLSLSVRSEERRV